jgi:hypothetical protein
MAQSQTDLLTTAVVLASLPVRLWAACCKQGLQLVITPARLIFNILFPSLLNDMKQQRLALSQQATTTISETICTTKKLVIRIALSAASVACLFWFNFMLYCAIYCFLIPVTTQEVPLNFGLVSVS